MHLRENNKIFCHELGILYLKWEKKKWDVLVHDRMAASNNYDVIVKNSNFILM